MADAKWIEGLRPTMPLVDAARQALTLRLEAVRERLPQALYQAEADVEHVHQLRVSTRRAGAALHIFGTCMPRKNYKRMRDPLRRLRRAAGAARDWDVFLLSLKNRGVPGKPENLPALDFLTGYGQGQRLAAQTHLIEATQQPPLAFDQILTETLEVLRSPGTEPITLRDHAVPLLSGLFRELNQAAKQDLGNYEHLHQVRILGKRLRYALEIFVCCFGSIFQEELYPAVAQMQEILGQANDSYGATRRLETIRQRLLAGPASTWKRLAPGMEKWIALHQRQMPKQSRLFLAWLKRWQALGAADRLEEMMETTKMPVNPHSGSTSPKIG